MLTTTKKCLLHFPIATQSTRLKTPFSRVVLATRAHDESSSFPMPHSPRRGSLHACSSKHHRCTSSRTCLRSRTFSLSSHTRVKPSHELSVARLSPAHASISKHSCRTRTTPSCLRVRRELARTPSQPSCPRMHAHAIIHLGHEPILEKNRSILDPCCMPPDCPDTWSKKPFQ